MNGCIFTVMLFLICIVSLGSLLGMGQNITGSPVNQTATTAPSRLRIAIPVREFEEFVIIRRDPTTGEKTFGGLAIEVFRAVANTALSGSPILFDLIPFSKRDGTMNGTFDEMLKAVFSQEYDGAVGGISILFYRLQWVDFTLPYLDTSISMLVRLNHPLTSKNGGISLVAVTKCIVAATIAFSFLVALVFWILEHKNDKHTSQQLSLAQSTRNDEDWRRELMGSMIQTRLVIILFFMVMLILIACYTASQTSSFTEKRRSASFENLNQLIRKEANVGYREGSYVVNLLLLKGIPESKLISLNSEEEMVDMLSKGTAQDGVDAIVANTPHLKLFLAKHCGTFTIVSTVNLPAAGFGFAFRKESELANEFSKGILKVTDNGQLGRIRDRTIGSFETCEDEPDNNAAGSNILDPDSLWILVVGGIAVFILMAIILLLYCGIRCSTRKKKVVAYPCYLLPCC